MDISTVSRPIRFAVLLVGLEALTLVGFAIADLVQLDRDRLSLGLTNAVFFMVYAIGLGLAGWGLLGLRRWSRGPIVLAQLIQLGVAYSFAGSGTTWVAVVLACIAVPVLVVMFAPATTQALYGFRDDTVTEGDELS